MINFEFELMELAAGIVAALPGVILSRWLGFRDGRKAAQEEFEEEDADTEEPVSGHPYRSGSSPGAPATVEPEEEKGWLYNPQDECPRCHSDHDIRFRGRHVGPHTLDLDSAHFRQSDSQCTANGDLDCVHMHYQCYTCGCDWAEIPPEKFDAD